MEDDDFDYKIKWFFDRIEQQAAQNTPVEKPQAPQKDDFESFETQDKSTVNQESSFSSNPIESDSHSTNEDTQSNDEQTLLGKRKHSCSIKDSTTTTNKRQKITEDNKDLQGTNNTCFFPQFENDLKEASTKKRLAK
jgi:hypothetical protein